MILGLDNIASPKLVYLNHYLLIFFGPLTCEPLVRAFSSIDLKHPPLSGRTPCSHLLRAFYKLEADVLRRRLEQARWRFLNDGEIVHNKDVGV